jgi:hypothetical protein
MGLYAKSQGWQVDDNNHLMIPLQPLIGSYFI